MLALLGELAGGDGALAVEGVATAAAKGARAGGRNVVSFIDNEDVEGELPGRVLLSGSGEDVAEEALGARGG